MIAVVADDFTGAAEIGGLGLRYGLNVEVQTAFDSNSRADLVAIDTDTRSRTSGEAAAEVEKLANQLQKVPLAWIYKKVDSVMRGHVLAELQAMLAALGRQKALLVPANPSRGRTIAHGRYFIHGQPLHETDFARDPEYPVSSSDVLELLGPSKTITTCVLQRQQPIPAQGIAIGEAESKNDLLAWAARLDDQSIPAGAAEFFAALLEVRGFRAKPFAAQTRLPRQTIGLFVCGSGSVSSHKAIEEARSRGVPVCEMPSEFFQTDKPPGEAFQRWSDDSVSAFQQHSQVIVTVGQPAAQNPALTQRIRDYTAVLVADVLKRIAVEELWIEGGATASAVVRHLRWRRFFPCQELSPGVVRMRVEGKRKPYLTVKPGSYPWPAKIWRFTP